MSYHHLPTLASNGSDIRFRVQAPAPQPNFAAQLAAERLWQSFLTPNALDTVLRLGSASTSNPPHIPRDGSHPTAIGLGQRAQTAEAEVTPVTNTPSSTLLSYGSGPSPPEHRDLRPGSDQYSGSYSNLIAPILNTPQFPLFTLAEPGSSPAEPSNPMPVNRPRRTLRDSKDLGVMCKCGKSFNHKADLKRHSSTSCALNARKSTPISCPNKRRGCMTTFARKDALLIHIERHRCKFAAPKPP